MIYQLEIGESAKHRSQLFALLKMLCEFGAVDISTSSLLNVHWKFGSDTLVNRPTAPWQNYVSVDLTEYFCFVLLYISPGQENNLFVFFSPSLGF